MTWGFAYPKPIVEKNQGDVLTFIVPAPNGCDLKCPYCFIAQRGERKPGTISLTPSDYAYFADAIARTRLVSCLAIQGEEPLLPESLDYTHAILNVANRYQIPSSIVTNGTHLESQVTSLANSGIDYLAVSLDGATAGIHDKLRGVPGAFDAILAGLKAASDSSVLHDSLLVTSVLLPGKTGYLMELPKLLNTLSISKWFVNPLISFNKDKVAGPVSNDFQILSDFRMLQDEAWRWRVEMTICDDYNQLSHLRNSTPALRNMRFKVLGREVNILRLLPDGSCASGYEILHTHQYDLAVWRPDSQRPEIFVENLIGRNGVMEYPNDDLRNPRSDTKRAR